MYNNKEPKRRKKKNTKGYEREKKYMKIKRRSSFVLSQSNTDGLATSCKICIRIYIRNSLYTVSL